MVAQEEQVTSPTILEEAATLISGARRDAYGDVRESFATVAAMWSVILRRRVTPSEVARCMIALKLCRENSKAARDNRVDICGYAALLDQLETL